MDTLSEPTLICKRDISKMSDVDKEAWVFEKEALKLLGFDIIEDGNNIFIYLRE